MDITSVHTDISTTESNSARLDVLSSTLMKTEMFGKLRHDGWTTGGSKLCETLKTIYQSTRRNILEGLNLKQ
jgi:hypothetical protein